MGKMTAAEALVMSLHRQTLLFIRHAETAMAGTFCGSSNPPLNDRGLAQLPGLEDRLTSFQIDAVHTSDLLRAHQTAQAIAAIRNLPCQSTPALREIDFGQWESLDWEAIERRDKSYADRWVHAFPELPAPGGESIACFRHRILNEAARLRTLAASHAQTLAIVTHAGVLRCLLEDLCHFSPHHAWERTRDYTCILHCTQTSPVSALEVQP